MYNTPEAKQARSNSNGSPGVTMYAWLTAALFAITMAFVTFQRVVFNYRTETDFIGGFVRESIRFLESEPLSVSFHPPFYSITVGLAYLLVDEWMTAGLAVSLVASIAVLLSSFHLLKPVLGVPAALGAFLALLVSPVYLYYSLQATSEVFSLALYLGAFLAVFISLTLRSWFVAIVAGILIGLALLTRTNHVVLLLLLLFYFIPFPADPVKESFRKRMRLFGLASVGIAIPLAFWIGFASTTGAPVMPTKTHENLALTFYSTGNRISGEERRAVAPLFDSTSEVLLADPMRIVEIYAGDLVRNTYRLLAQDRILPVPMVALGVLGWLAILIREREKRLFTLMVFVNLAAMYLLLGLKAFEARYYIYLLPFVGAGIGYLVATTTTAILKGPRPWLPLVILVFLFSGTAAIKTVPETVRLHTADWSDDAYAAAGYIIAAGDAENAAVYSLKGHLRYYAGAARTVSRVEELRPLLRYLRETREETGETIYVFYGALERRSRPELAKLAYPPKVQAWGLREVAKGPEGGGWLLYELEEAPGH